MLFYLQGFPLKRSTPMPTIVCGTASLAVAGLFYAWRAYHDNLMIAQRQLRQRVACMLWVLASGARD